MVLIVFGPFALNCLLLPLPLLIQSWFIYVSPCKILHVLPKNLCHLLGLGFVTTTYVIKESYAINHYAMKAYVTRTYATKAHVTEVYNITKVIVILV